MYQVAETAAEHAALVLAEIEKHPDNFDVRDWVMARMDGGSIPMPYAHRELPPDLHPAECDTTLCVAGWAAHLDGWTLQGDGMCYRQHGPSYIPRSIEVVAAAYLGLSSQQADLLFYNSPPGVAMAILRHLHERRRFPALFELTDIDGFWQSREEVESLS